jgi:uncharacterized protein (DUF58 family)
MVRQYTAVPPRASAEKKDSRVYADLDELVRLQFKATGFSFLPRQPVHSILYGRHASRLRGRGLNFEELRRYVPGDDIRNVDWKATARAGEPNVRVFTEERDRPVWLLVNQCQSMFFGSEQKMKSVIAAEAAALAAWRSLANGDRVGGMIYDDDDIVSIKPQRSRDQVMRLLSAVTDKNHALSAGNDTSADVDENPVINRLLRQLLPLAPHDCLVCMIGDGGKTNAETSELITRLTEHNDLIFILVFDPMERSLPNAGRLTGGDGRRELEFDSSNARLREAFGDEFSARLQGFKGLSRRHAIPLLPISTAGEVAPQVREQLGQLNGPGRI